MAEHMPSPQQQAMELEKKLHKRERRIQERLQEAQAACAKAQERLTRAENPAFLVLRIDDVIGTGHQATQIEASIGLYLDIRRIDSKI